MAGVDKKIIKILNNLIWGANFALVLVTPLLFSTKNSELFEVPKMLFVYLIAIIIFFATLVKFILSGKIAVSKNSVLVTFLIFVIIQMISTVFSIDKFTSVFGYPSRLNGGLLSQFAYLVIIWGVISNFFANQARKLLVAIVLGATTVSLWGIPAHFGWDPSCLILVGNGDSSCWQSDFNPKLRIFSTLGQPNWLASYLVLTLPLTLALFLVSKRLVLRIIFGLLIFVQFLAFIFTNSRSGAVGLLIGLAVFGLLLGSQYIRRNIRTLALVTLMLVISASFFGITLFLRVDDTAKIRQIVWTGALEVFKHWPFLGSGPETFAYSYYLYRPIAHNSTAEWNFFYNKAHNEFLNYLATIGSLGLMAYLFFLVTALVAIFKINKQPIIAKATVAAIVGYQVAIFFGFSTVTPQVVMFMLIAIALTFGNKDAYEFKINENYWRYVGAGVSFLIGLVVLAWPLRLFLADLSIAEAKNNPNSRRGLAAYEMAIATFPTANPFYLADYAYDLVIYFSSVSDSEISPKMIKKSTEFARRAEEISPANLIVERKIANTYFLAALTDKSYADKALATAQKLPRLAPTDPQSYFALAKIEAGLDRRMEAKKSLEEALMLKADYKEAKDLLEQLKNDN